MKYSDEPCSTCGAPATALVLGPRGHVTSTACGDHLSNLAQGAIAPAHFIVRVDRKAAS